MQNPNPWPPGLSKLFTAYLDNFEQVSEFYNGDYRNHASFLATAQNVKRRELPIGKLVPILNEQNQRFGCGVPTLDKINLLLERQACAVITGQQTGLFTGPLYTIYKALTTVKLAERLNRTCEGCYVPIFWLASDDHDFREVNHVNIIDKENRLHTSVYAGHDVDKKVPVSSIELNSQVGQPLEQLETATHPSEFKAGVLEILADAYQPGTSFAAAFGTFMMHLFKSFGLILIDASDPRIKDLGKSVFQKEISGQSPSTQAALQASRNLLDKGYHNQVQVQENFLNLFYVDGERRAIESKDDLFAIKGTDREFDSARLLKAADETPELFSPNVLLRPILQDTLLPTVAYVGGPAEVAYYAQMKEIYDRFDLEMPIIYPRKSITLLESKIEKVLETYELSVADLWGNEDHLINEIVKARLPEALEKRIEETSLSINKRLQDLEEVVVGFEPTLANTVENVKGRIFGQMEVLEKKILQAYKKRNEVIHLQIKKVKSSLYPNNQLQERALNILPFLFKHGPGFIDQLYEAVDISNFDHQVIKL